MARLTKNQKTILTQYDFNKIYPLAEGISLVKASAYTKFDASVDLAVRLGVNPQKAEQMVRGVVTLPYGTGKPCRVLALCTPDKEQEAREAGADHVGLEEYLNKIAQGWTDIDVIVTQPTLMAKLGKLGKIIGPRGLMPNPKTGTVTLEIGKAIKEIKGGKISFKMDKNGIIHASIGRLSFSPQQLVANVSELVTTIIKIKPSAAKGAYIKNIALSSTMGKGVIIDQNSVNKL